MGDGTRTVIAGIKVGLCSGEKLEGRLTVVVANLAPRKMKFGVSEGMCSPLRVTDRAFFSFHRTPGRSPACA